jgi:Double zinc ribbon
MIEYCIAYTDLTVTAFWDPVTGSYFRCRNEYDHNGDFYPPVKYGTMIRSKRIVAMGGMLIPSVKKKKHTICPRCKKTVPVKTAFCESCGARVANPPSCSLCGTLLAPGSRFCPSCGTPVPANPDQPEIPAESVQQSHEGVLPFPENSASSVTGAPEIAAESLEQDLPVIPEKFINNSVTSKPTGNQRGERAKRSVVTILSEPDAPARTVFSRIPLVSIISHKYHILILVAFMVFIVMAASGGLRLPALYSSGAKENLSAEVTQSTLEQSAVDPDQNIATATIVPPVISFTPGPTEVPPDNLLVYFQAERDPTTRIVSVQFMGGKGQAGVQDVFVRLTRSDGEILSGSFKPIQAGSGVELQGTEKVDRVEVIVHYYTGDSYTVIDRAFEWKKQL